MEQKEEFKGAEVREFVDDGYSGTNFDRPAMKEMLRLCKQGEINCIIVKDLFTFWTKLSGGWRLFGTDISFFGYPLY